MRKIVFSIYSHYISLTPVFYKGSHEGGGGGTAQGSPWGSCYVPNGDSVFIIACVVTLSVFTEPPAVFLYYLFCQVKTTMQFAVLIGEFFRNYSGFLFSFGGVEYTCHFMFMVSKLRLFKASVLFHASIYQYVSPSSLSHPIYICMCVYLSRFLNITLISFSLCLNLIQLSDLPSIQYDSHP